MVNLMFLSSYLALILQVLRRDFSPFLMQVLYPLLEKLGDDSAYISSAAFLALLDISQSCGYK